MTLTPQDLDSIMADFQRIIESIRATSNTREHSAERDIARERVKVLDKICERLKSLEEHALENNIRAYGWMEAHDKLKAGKPYKFPSPVDKDELRERLKKTEEALKRINDGTHVIVPKPSLQKPMTWDGVGEIFNHNCHCEKCEGAKQLQRDRLARAALTHPQSGEKP